MTAPTFTYSGNVYTAAAAGSTDFALTSTAGNAIAYLEAVHIHVYQSTDQGETWTELARPSHWNFVSSGTVARLASGIASGTWIKVQRETPSGSSYVNFQASSLLTAEQLNTESLFNTYLYQEAQDQADQTTTRAEQAVATADQAVVIANAALPKAGGTMTGALVLNGNPTTGLEAATKQYVDASDGTLQADINTRWNKSSDTIDSTEPWGSADDKIPTTQAADKQFSTIVGPVTPAGTGWAVGKTWLQNDVNKTLSIWNGSGWLGVASGGTFTSQPTVIYVDAANGNDADDGHRIINPKKTIKAAVAAAAAGDIIKVSPGVYQEVLPINITVDNLSIVGDSQRSCFVHPTPATETQVMFRCNSGTYIDGFTFAGLKASGTRGGHPIDNNATYGLPTNQGWVAGFYPGCSIKKSPFINNCTNFADSGIDNSSFNPNNYSGTGGDTTSAPTGGGIIVDGSLPAPSSPLRSFVINEFTQVCLDGPGLLVCNNGYAQAVSFFGLFCHYHAKALSGGQINMEVGTTDFGRYGLIADGKSTTPIFTATANGAASAGAITFNINAPTASGGWFGDANRPAINMLVQVGSAIYPILSSGPNGSGWSVTISRPNPSNRAENLGLISSISNGAAVQFYLRSMISTASHTFEYAGSGTDYTALPENGGVPIEANESTSRNDGKVWLTSTDQSGKFKVGDTFAVDQQTGFVTIDPNSYSTNLVTDLSPQLGGDLDVFGRSIFNSTGNIVLNDAVELLGGSAAAPSLTFTGDTNSGLFRVGADQIAVATGGIERIRFDANGQVELAALGTALLPALSWIADPDTGIYSSGANVLDVTTGGTAKVRFDNTTAPLKEIYSSAYYPVVTSVDIGSAPDQVSLNYMLGNLAFMDDIDRLRASATAPTNSLDINFEYVSDTSIKVRMRGSDGTVRSATLTLS